MTAPLRIAIAGVGNCASSLVQGLSYYRSTDSAPAGLMHDEIGGWTCADLEVVAAFDIDRRKVGRPLANAIFAPPNCAQVFQDSVSTDCMVEMGPVLDGVAAHMADYPEERAFRHADLPPVDIAATLKGQRVDVLISYMPVGADLATRAYAEACLQAGVAMVNCAPCFIASDPGWAMRFTKAGVPIVGDDIKSQVGATIVHRTLAKLFSDRGAPILRSYQLNTGGNTDFLNMLARDRLASKKKSKTGAVQAELPLPLPDESLHVGPSDYVPWQKDNKLCFLRIEAAGWGGTPIELELRLSVQDSPNSAGVVIDAVRCAGLALRRGLAGPLVAASAYLMKSPPYQITDGEARQKLEQFLATE